MRGTVIGEKVVSQAQTKEYDEGFDRTFGADRKPVRGRWVWDEQAQKLVEAHLYVRPDSRALDAPIMVDRFYEGQQATDGTDIGSRAKHREYMRRNGVTVASDFGPGWNERQKAAQAQQQAREVEATVAEATRRAVEMNQHDYDRMAEHQRRQREERARRSGFQRDE